MPNGVDVYTAYQSVVSWPAVKAAGYDFAYVKVSDGTKAKDDGGYGPKGRSAGLAMGAYHYGQPGDPVAQADLLCSRATAAGLVDLAPALDLEDPFKPDQAAIDFAVAFVRRIEANGFRPCLYASDSMMRTVRGPVKLAVPDCYIWVARYGATPTVQYDVWQWSDKGSVPGISASGVDLDRGIVPRNTSVQALEADDLTPEEHNRQIWIEQALRTLINQVTGDPKGDPSFDANMAWVDGHLPGFPNGDGSQHFTLAGFARQADWNSYIGRTNTDKLVGTTAPAVALSDDELTKIATAILSALPATLAQSVVDEISRRLEGTK